MLDVLVRELSSGMGEALLMYENNDLCMIAKVYRVHAARRKPYSRRKNCQDVGSGADASGIYSARRSLRITGTHNSPFAAVRMRIQYSIAKRA